VSVTVVMPALGESVNEATVTRWLKQPGDAVVKGEPLLEVSTDKVDTEVESPESGTLVTVMVEPSTTVDVGTEIARIQIAESETGGQRAGEFEGSGTDAHTTGLDAMSQNRASFLSPAVRALVREHPMRLEAVAGSGANGRVTRRDVLTIMARRASTPSLVQVEPAETRQEKRPDPISAPDHARMSSVPLSTLRRTIARRMLDSLHVSAQLTTVVEVDVTAIAQARASCKDSPGGAHGGSPSYLSFIARATCEALSVHPVLNASIDTDTETVTYHHDVHLGIAVDTERGLMVPVIPSAGDLNVHGLSRKISDLADRTRGQRISVDELAGGTFTLTNTGSRGALFDTPILNQPQVGILGFGSVLRRPVAITLPGGEEVIAVRSMAHLALTYDHRLVDGADAARFLSTVKARIERASFDIE